jgi:hypothetical protein
MKFNIAINLWEKAAVNNYSFDVVDSLMVPVF